MWKRHLGFSISLALIALLNLLAEALKKLDIRLIVSPLICLLLMIYLASKTRLYGSFRKLIFVGLIFSLLGDCALFFEDLSRYFFLAGLWAYILCYLAYSLAFYRDFRSNPQATKKYGHAMLFIAGVFFISYYTWLQPYLTLDFRFPVTVTMLSISLMVILAGYRYHRVNSFSFRMIFWGAVLLALADAVLFYHQFAGLHPFTDPLIIITYILAQYLITLGAIERRVANKNRPTKVWI
ncbi:MAG TPA: lysoplasmalogenase [Daejeonella sp.]|nr:lysoplasmalogenase [Daejeonella sp.]